MLIVINATSPVGRFLVRTLQAQGTNARAFVRRGHLKNPCDAEPYKVWTELGE